MIDQQSLVVLTRIINISIIITCLFTQNLPITAESY